jgi:predicted dehydrogenase
VSDGKIKVGIVGLQRGHEQLGALATHPRVELAALCDLDTSVLADLGDEVGIDDSARFTSYEDLVSSDIDVVMIATPIEFHAEETIKALDAGKHVLCEQTQAYTVEDCEAVIAAEQRSGKVYMMAENYTYFHYVQQWKEKIEAGKLGQIYYAEGEYLHEILTRLINPETGEHEWRYTRPPIHYCAHPLGPLLTLMGDRIVRATGKSTGNLAYPAEGEGFIDMEVGLFETEKGAIIKILRSQVTPRHHELIWYSIHGTKGFIENGRSGGYGETEGLYYTSDERTPEEGAVAIPCNTSDPDAPEEARRGGHGTSEYLMVRDFIGAIDSGTRAPIDSVRASDFTVPGIIAHEAAKAGGTWMDVPLLG